MLVSFVCPTFNRPHKHEGLYAGFCADSHEPRELVVLDGSAEPSPFFSALKDDRVRYFHEPEAPREQGVTRIGAIRNRLTQLAKGEILRCVDDDDAYDPAFTVEALRRLGDADVCKWVVWRLLHSVTGDVYLWDQRTIGGPVYALRGSTVEQTDMNDMSPEEATAFRDAWQLGFMWSAVFRKKVAEEIPFPEEGTEDVPWMRALVAAGKKIVLVADAPELALHVVEPNPMHIDNGSAHFPQVRLRQASARRMMGAGIAAMNELPQGQSIQIEPGKTYRVLAALRATHSLKSVETRAAHWGLKLHEAIDNADPAQYGVAAPPEGYRLVDFIGVADKAVPLPWQAPRFAQAIGEKSHVVRAWIGAGRPDDGIDDGWMLRVFVGAGTLGPKGRDEGAVGGQMSSEDTNPSRYDPKRFAGREPPHKCTAKSADAIAQQLPGAPWSFWGNVTSHDGMRENEATITTGMGQKTIPYWTDNLLPDGGRNRGTMPTRLVLQCPFTGELWTWFSSQIVKQPKQLGAGKPYVAPPDAPPPVPSRAQFAVLQGRPDPASPPSDINDWLNAHNDISPYWAYPEFGWYAPHDPDHPETAWRADFDIPISGLPAGITNGHVWWWLQKDGSWGYYHQWGTNLGKTLDQLANAVADVAQGFGFVGAGQFVYALHAAAGNGSPAVLAASLNADWNNFQSSEALASAVASKDWQRAWDIVTKDGTELGELKNAFAGGNAPDRQGNLTIPGVPLPPTGQCPAGQVWSGVACVNANPVGVHAPEPAAKRSSGGLMVVGVVVGVAAVAAAGVGVYAALSRQDYVQAWKTVLGMGAEQTTKSGQLLVDAGPQKLLLRGAAEPKKAMRPQSLLFPVNRFTPAQAKAWARSHGYKAAKVDTTAQYHRIRQFSPAKATVLRTISFGDSGIRAVVAK